MVWQQIVLIVYLILSMLCSVMMIGKSRRPMKPSDAMFSIIIVIALIALVATI